MQQLRIPLVGCITKHETLIAGTYLVLLIFFSVNCVSDIRILFMHILNDIAIVAVEADVLTREAHLLADFAGNLLVVYLEVRLLLLAGQGHFTE